MYLTNLGHKWQSISNFTCMMTRAPSPYKLCPARQQITLLSSSRPNNLQAYYNDASYSHYGRPTLRRLLLSHEGKFVFIKVNATQIIVFAKITPAQCILTHKINPRLSDSKLYVDGHNNQRLSWLRWSEGFNLKQRLCS